MRQDKAALAATCAAIAVLLVCLGWLIFFAPTVEKATVSCELKPGRDRIPLECDHVYPLGTGEHDDYIPDDWIPIDEETAKRLGLID